MKVQAVGNQTFTGIKLSSNEFEKVRDMVFLLNRTGFDNIGHQSVVCNNTLADKIKVTQEIRKYTGFLDREFGALFFPWSQEAYLIATPQYEQLMYSVVKQYDKGAKINIAI